MGGYGTPAVTAVTSEDIPFRTPDRIGSVTVGVPIGHTPIVVGFGWALEGVTAAGGNAETCRRCGYYRG